MSYLKTIDFPIHFMAYWWLFWIVVSYAPFNSRVLNFVHAAAIAPACMLVATMMSPVLRPAFLRAVRGRLS